MDSDAVSQLSAAVEALCACNQQFVTCDHSGYAKNPSGESLAITLEPESH